MLRKLGANRAWLNDANGKSQLGSPPPRRLPSWRAGGDDLCGLAGVSYALLDMPTVLRWKGYRFLFWSGDRGEPPHVHVKKDAGEAKVWLAPVRLKAVDFKDHEIREIVRKVQQQQATFLKAWHDHIRP
jgi:Domain of unknown function (DUF4160)